MLTPNEKKVLHEAMEDYKLKLIENTEALTVFHIDGFNLLEIYTEKFKLAQNITKKIRTHAIIKE